jgi:hypothetical protein
MTVPVQYRDVLKGYFVNKSYKYQITGTGTGTGRVKKMPASALVCTAINLWTTVH